MNKTTEALKLAEEALHNVQNALLFVSGSVNDNTTSTMTADAHDDADKALAAIRETLAEPVKQEPVARMDLHKELGQLRWMGGDEGWDNAIHAVRKRLEKLYAAPVDAKAIRTEALEQAAKMCDAHSEFLAQAIRGLK